MLLASVIAADAAPAAQISYSGRLDGRTVPNAYVIPATFAPSYAGNYFIDYGDPASNLNAGAFVQATADGNLIPIGLGTQTAADGTFSGSGSTSAALGTSIYLFAFDAPIPIAGYQVIATSTASNWKVSAADATLFATEANIFLVGRSSPGGITLMSIPIPEPMSAATLFGMAATIRSRARLPT